MEKSGSAGSTGVVHVDAGLRNLNGSGKVLDRIAKSDLNVLIWGGSAEARDLLSRHLFEGSIRAAWPFVSVVSPYHEFRHCIEFLATGRRPPWLNSTRESVAEKEPPPAGCIDTLAGTMFIDSISTLPLESQRLLLRILESREISAWRRYLDFRIISGAASLPEEPRRRTHFLAELHFRLNEVSIHISSGQLARTETSRDAPSGQVEARSNPLGHLPPDSLLEAARWARLRAEKIAIEKVLSHTGGNRWRTARLLKISPNRLGEKIRSLQIESP